MDFITIALTHYKEPAELLRQCLESIAMQEKVWARIFVLDQKERLETRALCRRISSDSLIFEYHIIPALGSS